MKLSSNMRIQFCVSNSTHVKMWGRIIPELRQRNIGVSIEMLSLDSYYKQCPISLFKDINADEIYVLERSWSGTAYWDSAGFGRLLLIVEALVRTISRLLFVRPIVIVLGNDIGIIEVLIIRVASLLDVPTLLVQDGILNGNLRRENNTDEVQKTGLITKLFEMVGIKRNRIYGHGGAYSMAVMGEYTYELLTNEGKNMDKVFITGQPRFDDYAELVQGGLISHMSTEVRREYNIAKTDFTLGFFSQPFISYGLMDSGKWDYIVSSIFLSASEVLEKIDGYLIVKLHPAENYANFVDRYSKYINALGDHIILEERMELQEAILMSDLVIVNSSTVSLEALLVDKAVILFDPYEFRDDYNFVKMGAAMHAATKDDLVKSILALRDSGSKEEMRNARYRAVDYHIWRFAEPASSRIADLIVDLGKKSD